jgi:hypothetical protein
MSLDGLRDLVQRGYALFTVEFLDDFAQIVGDVAATAKLDLLATAARAWLIYIYRHDGPVDSMRDTVWASLAAVNGAS